MEKRLYLIAECKFINVQGMIESDKHLANVKTISGKNQWMLKCLMRNRIFALPQYISLQNICYLKK